MLMVFKARDCSSVTMLPKDGRHILTLLGKVPEDAAGVVTVEQLPHAIAALQSAITADKAASPPAAGEPGDSDEEGEHDAPVRLYQRAQPVLALLECARAAEAPVTWGV